MEGMRMDSTAMTVCGKEFRESGMEIIRNKGGNDVFFAVGNDEEVMGTNSVEVVLLSRTREDTWLRTSRTGSVLFSICVHGLGF